MEKGICQLYLKEANLVKSHIIPKCFFVELKDGSDHLLLLGSDIEHEQRSRIGIYDAHILSREVEKLLEKLDNYGAQIIRSDLARKSITDGVNTVYYWELAKYDFITLKKFFISILWRASISQRDEFASVDLGKKYNEITRKILLDKHSLNDPRFEIIIQKYTRSNIENLEKSFLNPQRHKFENRNSYVFYISNLKVCVKVDNRNLSSFWEPFIMKEGRPLTFIEKDFDSSKERQLMEKLMNKYENQTPQ